MNEADKTPVGATVSPQIVGPQVISPATTAAPVTAPVSVPNPSATAAVAAQPPQEPPVSTPATGFSGTSTPAAGGEPLSALETAMHHVVLWCVTGGATVNLAVLAAAFAGYVSSALVLSFVAAASLVSVIAYALFYGHFLRRLLRDGAVTVGKVWSIITIALHSVTALAMLVAIVTGFLGAGEDLRTPLLIGAGSILVLNLAVATTYFTATFVSPLRPLRKTALLVLPVIAILIVGGFGLAGMTKIGPVKADKVTRKHLYESAAAVLKATEKSDYKLPEKSSALKLAEGVTYRRVSDADYELCAEFKTINKAAFDPYYGIYGSYLGTPYDLMSEEEPGKLYDSYLSEASFTNDEAGNKCFKIESSLSYDYSLDSGINLDASNSSMLPYSTSPTSTAGAETLLNQYYSGMDNSSVSKKLPIRR